MIYTQNVPFMLLTEIDSGNITQHLMSMILSIMLIMSTYFIFNKDKRNICTYLYHQIHA